MQEGNHLFFACYFAHLFYRWQTKYGLSGVNHHEDSLPGTTRLDSMGRNLDRYEFVRSV